MGQFGLILDRIELNDPIRVEKFVLVQLDGGCIDIAPAGTVYLTCPADIVKQLQSLGINLKNRQDRAKWKIEASLTIEETPEGRREVRVSHHLSEKYTRPQL